jgi:hypothetical protein
LLKQGCELNFSALSDPGFLSLNLTLVFQNTNTRVLTKSQYPDKNLGAYRIRRKMSSSNAMYNRFSLRQFFSLLLFGYLDLIMGPRWWQSPSLQYGSAYQSVTLTINLKQLYQVTFNLKGLSHDNETLK